MVNRIAITVSKGINEIIENMAKKLGKTKSTIVRELMEQKLNEMSLISSKIKDE